jgi:hypothetical protein
VSPSEVTQCSISIPTRSTHRVMFTPTDRILGVHGSQEVTGYKLSALVDQLHASKGNVIAQHRE